MILSSLKIAGSGLWIKIPSIPSSSFKSLIWAIISFSLLSFVKRYSKVQIPDSSQVLI